MIKNILIAVLFLVIIGLVTYEFRGKFSKEEASNTPYSGLEKKFETLDKDFEFYKYLAIYDALLPDDKYKILKDRYQKMSKELDTENSEAQKMLTLSLASVITSDKAVQPIVTELRDSVALLKKNSKIDQDALFAKNTECAKLTSNIKEELSKNSKSTLEVTEKEEFNFIFYSPTLNTCVYSTKYDYNYFNYKSVADDNYSKSSYRLYDVSSSKQLGDYPYYYFGNVPYTSKDEQEKNVENGRRDYKKFILENSAYNATLLKELNY